MWNHRLTYQDDAGEVEAHHLIEQLLGQLAELGAFDEPTRVVDQNVDAPVAERQGFLREPLDLGLLGHVGPHDGRASSERLHRARGVGRRGFAALIVDDDVGALLGQGQADSAADIAATTRNQRRFSGDVEEHFE